MSLSEFMCAKGVQVPGKARGQCWRLESWAVVSHLMWLLGISRWFSVGVVHSLNSELPLQAPLRVYGRVSPWTSDSLEHVTFLSQCRLWSCLPCSCTVHLSFSFLRQFLWNSGCPRTCSVELRDLLACLLSTGIKGVCTIPRWSMLLNKGLERKKSNEINLLHGDACPSSVFVFVCECGVCSWVAEGPCLPFSHKCWPLPGK